MGNRPITHGCKNCQILLPVLLGTTTFTMAAADASAMGLVNEHVANGAMNSNYVNVKMGEVVIENVPYSSNQDKLKVLLVWH